MPHITQPQPGAIISTCTPLIAALNHTNNGKAGGGGFVGEEVEDGPVVTILTGARWVSFEFSAILSSEMVYRSLQGGMWQIGGILS